MLSKLHQLYYCNICKTKPDQISHHKLHLKTQKHKDKKLIFTLQLQQSDTMDYKKIVEKEETKIENKKDNIIDSILSNPNKLCKMSGITNREALKDKIHEIHNFLRNNGAGYGMNSLKIFNIFYILKKIEKPELWEKIGLSEKCKFSNILKLCDTEEDEIIEDFIRNELLDEIFNSQLKQWLYNDIPSNIKSHILKYLVEEIDDLCKLEEKANFQLCGKIYEYFIGRDSTAISELGAYFTDRHIINYCYELVQPSIKIKNDGTKIYSMCDPFGGSGGFTLGYVNYILDKVSEEELKIDWSSELKEIFHYDVNDDVVKYAGLEMFCLTGEIPDGENLVLKNSFKQCRKKFYYIFTNPPYGGDKNNKSDKRKKHDKVIKWIKDEIKKEDYSDEDKEKMKTQMETLKRLNKQETDYFNKHTKVSLTNSDLVLRKFAKEHGGLKGNDKESVSLIMMMYMLKENGTACGVLKEGVFFDKKYSDIRKVLLEKFNVEYVVSVPQNAFENTSTKTSILVFHNNGSTTKVKFRELCVDVEPADRFEFNGSEVVMISNKGDIRRVYTQDISVGSFDDIAKNNYILRCKDYIPKEEVKINDLYEFKKLGDIAEFQPKSKRPASYGKSIGQYRFYSSSTKNKILYCDTADYKEEYVLFGDGGSANIKIDKMFSCSDHNILIKSNINWYIYYILKSNINLLENGFNGSTLKNIGKTYIKNLEIPIPRDEQKIQYWESYISEPYQNIQDCKSAIKTLEGQIQDEISRIIREEDCQEVKLGDVIKFRFGKKRKTTESIMSGKYNLYSSSLTPVYKFNKWDYENKSLIINTINGSGNFNVHIDEKFCVTSNTMVIYSNIVNIEYIYYILINNLNKLSDLSKGSGKKKLGKKEINVIKIKIPRDESLIEQNLQPLFDEIQELKQTQKENEELYKQRLQELNDDIFV